MSLCSIVRAISLTSHAPVPPDDVRIKEANLALLRSQYPSEERLSIYKGDICDADLMENIFEKERPKWVCHMAARAGVSW